MSLKSPSLDTKLSKHTPFFGIKLWVLILAAVALFIVLILLFTFLCIIYFRRRNSKSLKPRCSFRLSNPISCTNIHSPHRCSSALDKRLLSGRISDVEMNVAKLDDHTQGSGGDHVELVASQSAVVLLDARRGNRVALKEIEVVTNGFSDENVIGNGDHGIVYRGILLDTTRVAVKRLSKSCQAENFLAEVEVIRHARHKNLVTLVGYCVEEGYRTSQPPNMACKDEHHPWNCKRVSEVYKLSAAKIRLAYLHEGIEPKIINRNLKSTNILLDHQWNPKISDFGIAKLLGPDGSRQIVRSMEISGYLARGGASSGDKSDVYSFGILVMEIICGRTPVDHNQPQAFLVEWLKSMVSNQKIMYVVDPRLPEIPSTKELKRIVLLALRCVDSDMKHRPTMGDVIHMLEPRDLLLNDVKSG
ncbi:hypothetical protein Tsubulata_018376 [Turnera subulata]|uniref:non-specific serine/threonine protein kinase n=1 Tax=Turnera subulata TaxID=218843 RepID=A0A9Q0FMQ4_9ROSI|nr:hypothetical protein Tsubulata_018376 [Turnera subulata]